MPPEDHTNPSPPLVPPAREISWLAQLLRSLGVFSFRDAVSRFALTGFWLALMVVPLGLAVGLPAAWWSLLLSLPLSLCWVMLGIVAAWRTTFPRSVEIFIDSERPSINEIAKELVAYLSVAFSLIFTGFLAIFVATTRTLSSSNAASFNVKHLSRVDAMYYVVTTFMAVGFGDIAPTSAAARALTIVQMFTGFLLVVFFVGLTSIGMGARLAQAEPPREEPVRKPW